MKRLILCGIAILTVLGLMVSTSQAHRRGYHRGDRVGAAVGGAVLGGILGGLGASQDPYYSHPVVETYPAPVVYESPGYYGGYSYRDRPTVGLSIGGRRGGFGFGF